MQVNPIVTFHGIQRSASLEAEIAERLSKLERYHHNITSCRVLVERVQRHHETGNRFQVRIDLTIPGEEIVVSREAALHSSARGTGAAKVTKADELAREDKYAHVAVRKAFEVARRRLQDRSRRQRGVVKTVARPTQGRISRLFAVDEYGYLEAEDGHEVYFQRNSVLKEAFSDLTIGTAVSFVEESGEKGPQASTVRVLHPRRSKDRASKAAV